MKLSTMLMYDGDPRVAADQIAAWEQAGLDTVWVPEVYGYDSPTLMGYLAAKTRSVEIGAAILNIYSRSPAALAQTAAGLDHVSEGRAIIGLGASGPQVVEGFHGVPYERPLGRAREVVEVIRMALRREKLVYQGRSVRLPLPPGAGTGLGKPLKLLSRPPRPAVPLWLAALGAKNVELAAEIADGWIPHLFLPEKAHETWAASLAAGRAKRSDELGPLEIVAGGMCAIGEDVKGLLDFARPFVALYVGGMGAREKNFYTQLMCEYGYERQALAIQELYLDGKKEEAAAMIPYDFLDSINLVGPEGFVRERIAAYRDAGVTNLMVVPLADDAPALIGRMKELIG